MDMNTAIAEKDAHEAALVKSYMDLTGASDAEARGVYMYIFGVCAAKPGQNSNGAQAASEENRPSTRGMVPAS
jgi:hypothetical protein